MPHARFLAAAAMLLAFLPGALAAGKSSDLDIKFDVAVPQKPTATGASGEAVLTLTPPSGVRFNKYPPIRVTLENAPPITFDQTTVKVGLDAMPEDAETNHLDTLDPIHLPFKVGAHDGDAKVPIKGKVRLTYCVAKSGFCAPLTKDLAFELPISSP